MTTLSAVKHYMEDRRRTTVNDLAIGLSTTPDNARALLEMWRAKERVRLIPGACGTCGKGPLGGCSCGTAAVAADVYEWVKIGEPSGDAS